jgi:TolB-like protein
MSSAAQSTPPLEIGHVLVIDIVEFSKLLIQEESEAVQRLAQLVRGTAQFRTAEASGKLTRLPTGDGMVLVFYDSPESPVKCAIEIARAIQADPKLRLRMGIHSGPVSAVLDVNDRLNLTGAGINIAQRVMECAEAGHILLSKRTAEDLLPYRHWQPYLNEIGQCETKHGARLDVVNLVADDIGNPTLPSRFAPGGDLGRSKLFLLRKLAAIVLAIAGVTLLLWLAFLVWDQYETQTSSSQQFPTASSSTMPGVKRVAVLPFDNLSDKPENAYFAEGMQEEIITDLTRVANLKVISRTSVMQYKPGTERNLRDIAKTLGVTHVIEGSVQREHDRVRVHAQLIDARTDSHIWANQYDRNLADIFAIQSDIAEAIVSQLQASLSSTEKEAIEQRPTSDISAYALYIRAKLLNNSLSFSARGRENLFEMVRLLDQAVARDPNFFNAYSELAEAHDKIYLLGLDQTPARVALAEKAARTAVRLRPTSGRAHLALAHQRYSVLDYDEAWKELKIARQALPNDPRVYLIAGYIARRQNQWEESAGDMEQALELDPRNVEILQQLSLTYQNLRRFGDMAAVLDRALAVAPDDPSIRIGRSFVDLEWHANPKPLRSTVDAILVEQPSAAADIAQAWLYLSLCERNLQSAARALAAMTPDGCRDQGIPLPHEFCEGLVAWTERDQAAAQRAFAAARATIEQSTKGETDSGEVLCALSLADAGLGHRDLAIREGKRSVELLPLEKDAINGTVAREYLAVTYTWLGEKDLALEELNKVIKLPGWISYGQLRLHPFWNPLRGDPRFERMVASLAPSETSAEKPH